MTKTKAFITIAVLLACVSVFGAWTGTSAVGETRYADAPLLSTHISVTINYTRRDLVGPINTAGGCPCFHPVLGLTNSCGAVAGAEIAAFYDKYFPDLIPNWVSYYTANGKYRIQDSTVVPALIQEMYTRMRTNVDDVGVSEEDFLNGLSSYFRSKGCTISYQSVMSGNVINYEQCKTAVSNNKVIVLFTGPTCVYQVGSSENSDTIGTINIAGAHIMVIFGYCEVTYYNNSSLIGSYKFLNVAMGQTGYTSEFYDPNSTTTQAAYIVNVQ